MASGGGAGEARLKSYKTKGLNVEEIRRRREEEGIQLRRSKRDELYSKRRNLQVIPDYGEHLLQQQFTFPENSALEILAKALSSADPSERLGACSRLRKMLSFQGQNPPIQEVVSLGCLPKFVEFLQDSSSPTLQFESAWVLTNIASGSSLQTRAVIDTGAVPPLIQLLHSSEEFIMEQAIWALGNIAGDSSEYRDIVLAAGIMDPLLLILTNERLELGTRRNASWTLSNLCRGKRSPPNADLVMRCIPVLNKLLYYNDTEVLSNCCWTVAFLADGPNTKIQMIVDGGLSRRMVELLMFPDKKVVAPALRAVGNMLTGDDVQTQIIINCSVLPALQHLLGSQHDNLRKEACWAISNITAGNRVQIQSVIDCNIFPMLVDLLHSEAEYKTRKEAAWAILNATTGGTSNQIKYLVSINCIKPLCDMLTVQDPRIVLVTLEGLENILKVGKDNAKNEVNPYAVLIEEAYGLDKIEHLQEHSSEAIYQLSLRLIEKYFSDEEDRLDPSVVPQKTEDGDGFKFNSNANPPQGGFQF